MVTPAALRGTGILLGLGDFDQHIHRHPKVAKVVVLTHVDRLIQQGAKHPRIHHRERRGFGVGVPFQHLGLRFGVVAKADVPKRAIDDHLGAFFRRGFRHFAGFGFKPQHQVLKVAQLDERTGEVFVAPAFNADVFDNVAPFQQGRGQRGPIRPVPTGQHNGGHFVHRKPAPTRIFRVEGFVVAPAH